VTNERREPDTVTAARLIQEMQDVRASVVELLAHFERDQGKHACCIDALFTSVFSRMKRE